MAGKGKSEIEFAKKANIPLSPVMGTYGGPGGATGPDFMAKRQVNIAVDGQQTVPEHPQIFDMYAYEAPLRAATPDSSHKVVLGADFLLANQAVINFGTSMLFLRPTSVTAAPGS